MCWINTVHKSHRPRQNRFIAAKATKFLRKFPRCLVSASRLFLQALEANRLEINRHPRVEEPRRNRLIMQHLLQRVRYTLRSERSAAGEQMMQNRAEGIHITDRSHLAALRRG